ncbi:MAG: adenosylmethionine decarboxylase [Holophagaceae bacterium]|nr:adenosylmethionine decarboxylase [Holophagaceae bacterium]
MASLGRHTLAELGGCTAARLADLSLVESSMLEAARSSGATIVTCSFHHFADQDGGQGVSGAVIIAESHLAIHTWPEHHFAAVDFFTCGKGVDVRKALDHLKDAFQAQTEELLELERGPLRVGSVAVRG